MGRFRLYRFVRWYRRLRRNPLDAENPEFWGQLPRRFALSVAWYWSSDTAAFVRASTSPVDPDEKRGRTSGERPRPLEAGPSPAKPVALRASVAAWLRVDGNT